jgi:hypothetical protein
MINQPSLFIAAFSDAHLGDPKTPLTIMGGEVVVRA